MSRLCVWGQVEALWTERLASHNLIVPTHLWDATLGWREGNPFLNSHFCGHKQAQTVRKLGSGTFSAITGCHLGCLAFRQAPTSSVQQATGLGSAAGPATSRLMSGRRGSAPAWFSSALSQPEGGVRGRHSHVPPPLFPSSLHSWDGSKSK